jgi:hypothetical protein
VSEPTVEDAASQIAGGLMRLIIWRDQSMGDPYIQEGEGMLQDGIRQALTLLTAAHRREP